MHARYHLVRPLGAALLTALLAFSSATALADARRPVNVSSDTALPLRVLTRPGAALYQDQQSGTVINSSLPTFQSFFVYTAPEGEGRAAGGGWYEVGSDEQGNIVGWLKGEDVFEWKQTMCLTYSHPDGRDPVLMFEDDEYLETLIKSPAETRIKAITGLYDAIDKAAAGTARLPDDFPVISVEPKMAVDQSENFTLLPILDHRVVEIDGREARLLDMVAVSSTATDRKASDLRTNTEYTQSAATTSESQARKLENMKLDVVWLVDTTMSMGPYIDRVRNAMREISKSVAETPALADKIKFGIWGYRDSSEIAGLEYVTRNYTPELCTVDDFLKVMDDVQETKVDSVVFDEDVFSGVLDAISKTKWRENSTRLIILVGDAPGHELGHKWNASGQDQNTLRELANNAGVTLFALHLAPARTKKFNKQAVRQFSTLATNPGTGTPVMWSLPATDLDGFAAMAQELADVLIDFGANATKRFEETSEQQNAAAAPDAAPQSDSKPDKQNVRDLVLQSLHAAAVTWLGTESNVEPPRDIEAWVTDKDLTDPTNPSLEVRLLLSKAQLDTLTALLQEVLEAGATGQVSGDDFFTALQAASTMAARDPEKLANAQDLGSSGLIPAFLKGLPYHSRLMDMNNDLWASWGPDEQNAFLNNLEAKLKAYAAIHDDTTQWIALNAGDDPNSYVAPIQLELMP